MHRKGIHIAVGRLVACEGYITSQGMPDQAQGHDLKPAPHATCKKRAGKPTRTRARKAGGRRPANPQMRGPIRNPKMCDRIFSVQITLQKIRAHIFGQLDFNIFGHKFGHKFGHRFGHKFGHTISKIRAQKKFGHTQATAIPCWQAARLASIPFVAEW